MSTRSLLSSLYLLIFLLTACEFGDGSGKVKDISKGDFGPQALKHTVTADPALEARIQAISDLLEKGTQLDLDENDHSALVKATEELSAIDAELKLKGSLHPKALQPLCVVLEKLDRMLTIHLDHQTLMYLDHDITLHEVGAEVRIVLKALIKDIEQSGISEETP